MTDHDRGAKTPIIENLERCFAHTGDTEKLRALIAETTRLRAEGQARAFHEAAAIVPRYCRGPRGEDLAAELEMHARAYEAIATEEL